MIKNLFNFVLNIYVVFTLLNNLASSQLTSIDKNNQSKLFKARNNQKFSLLRDFTCAVAKDELMKHPEMRTIAMIELRNSFPKSFSREVLKCLPGDVAKMILHPHTHFHGNQTTQMTKSIMLIYVADNVVKVRNFQSKNSE